MLQKLKSYIFAAATSLMFVLPMAVPISVSAAACSRTGIGDIGTSISEGAHGAATGNDSAQCGDTGVKTSNLSKLGHSIVNIFSLIIGIIAVIMIIYAGFRYITSAGSTERVGAAKNTLIYALIGLIIVALAQVIVHFVLFQTDQAVK